MEFGKGPRYWRLNGCQGGILPGRESTDGASWKPLAAAWMVAEFGARKARVPRMDPTPCKSTPEPRRARNEGAF